MMTEPAREYLYFLERCPRCDERFTRKVAIRKRDNKYVYIPPVHLCGTDGELLANNPYTGKPLGKVNSLRLDRAELEKTGRVWYQPGRERFFGDWFYLKPPVRAQADRHLQKECQSVVDRMLAAAREEARIAAERMAFTIRHECATLGVVWPFTGEDVDRAYRTLAKELHPDRGGSTAKMARLTAANERVTEFLNAVAGTRF
jgi:hypothetical protein